MMERYGKQPTHKTTKIDSEILLKIEQLQSEIDKLINVNQELNARVQKLEQFECDFYAWQKQIRMRGGLVTGDSY